MVISNKGECKRLNKVISVVVLIAFAWSSVMPSSAYASALSASSASHHGTKENPTALMGSFELPEELGIIQERFLPQTKNPETLVLYLQSAHTNFDSESNTQKIIQFFEKNHGLPLVLLEGGAGQLDSLYFKSFPKSKAKEKVLNEYLKNGDLSGGEAASILNDSETKYFGIEEAALYEENKSAFLKASAKEPEILKVLDRADSELKTKMDGLSKPSNEFLDYSQRFRKEEINVIEYVKALNGLSGKEEIATNEKGVKSFNTIYLLPNPKYPELTQLLEIESHDKQVNSNDIDATVTQLLKAFEVKILNALPKAEQIEMNQMIQMYRLGHMSHGMLIKRIEDLSKARNFSFNTPEVLKPSIAQAKMISQIKGTELFNELEVFESELRHAIPHAESERLILDQFHELEILKRFAKLEITHKEWTEINKGNLINENQKTLFEHHFEFYRIATKRDEALFQNSIRMMNEEKAQVALISTGGFHTEGVTRKLKEKNIPYLLIAPKISAVGDRTNYLKAMRDERSFMKYFDGNLWDALAKDYASKLASLQNPGNLKHWRDRIIQNTMAEGRIADSGYYTKYIDALANGKLETVSSGSFTQMELNFKNRLKDIGDGLGQLLKSGNFNPDSIGKVLRQSTLQPESPLTNSPYIAQPKSVFIDQASIEVTQDLAPIRQSFSGALPAGRQGRSEARNDLKAQIKTSINTLPYRPDWLEDPKRSSIPNRTPREVLEESNEFVDFILRLKTLLVPASPKKLNSLEHRVGGFSEENSYQNAQRILTEQAFDWNLLGEYQHGKSVWGYLNDQVMGSASDHRTKLKFNFNGTLLEGSWLIQNEIDPFIQDHLKEIQMNRDPRSDEWILFTGYLIDLSLRILGFDGINHDKELLIKNPRSIKNISFVSSPVVRSEARSDTFKELIDFAKSKEIVPGNAESFVDVLNTAFQSDREYHGSSATKFDDVNIFVTLAKGSSVQSISITVDQFNLAITASQLPIFQIDDDIMIVDNDFWKILKMIETMLAFSGGPESFSLFKEGYLIEIPNDKADRLRTIWNAKGVEALQQDEKKVALNRADPAHVHWNNIRKRIFKEMPRILQQNKIIGPEEAQTISQKITLWEYQSNISQLLDEYFYFQGIIFPRSALDYPEQVLRVLKHEMLHSVLHRLENNEKATLIKAYLQFLKTENGRNVLKAIYQQTIYDRSLSGDLLKLEENPDFLNLSDDELKRKAETDFVFWDEFWVQIIYSSVIKNDPALPPFVNAVKIHESTNEDFRQALIIVRNAKDDLGDPLAEQKFNSIRDQLNLPRSEARENTRQSIKRSFADSLGIPIKQLTSRRFFSNAEHLQMEKVTDSLLEKFNVFISEEETEQWTRVEDAVNYVERILNSYSVELREKIKLFNSYGSAFHPEVAQALDNFLEMAERAVPINSFERLQILESTDNYLLLMEPSRFKNEVDETVDKLRNIIETISYVITTIENKPETKTFSDFGVWLRYQLNVLEEIQILVNQSRSEARYRPTDDSTLQSAARSAPRVEAGIVNYGDRVLYESLIPSKRLLKGKVISKNTDTSDKIAANTRGRVQIIKKDQVRKIWHKNNRSEARREASEIDSSILESEIMDVTDPDAERAKVLKLLKQVESNDDAKELSYLRDMQLDDKRMAKRINKNVLGPIELIVDQITESDFLKLRESIMRYFLSSNSIVIRSIVLLVKAASDPKGKNTIQRNIKRQIALEMLIELGRKADPLIYPKPHKIIREVLSQIEFQGKIYNSNATPRERQIAGKALNAILASGSAIYRSEGRIPQQVNPQTRTAPIYSSLTQTSFGFVSDLAKTGRIFKIANGPNGTSTVQLETPHAIFDSHLEDVEKTFQNVFQAKRMRDFIVELAENRSKNNQNVNVLDWGAGNLDALVELNIYLKSKGIKNVKLIGFANRLDPNWMKAPQNMTLIYDTADRLIDYFSGDGPLKNQRIDFVYSHFGLHHLPFIGVRGFDYSEHLIALKPFLADDARVVNNYGSIGNGRYEQYLKYLVPTLQEHYQISFYPETYSESDYGQHVAVLTPKSRSEVRNNSEIEILSLAGINESDQEMDGLLEVYWAIRDDLKEQGYDVPDEFDDEAHFISRVIDLSETSFVVMKQGEVVGFSLNDPYPRAGSKHLEIELMGVHPDHRDMGLGNYLLDASEDLARELDKSGLWLEVDIDNLPAVTRYEHFGFKVVGRNANDDEGDWIPIRGYVPMSKKLTGTTRSEVRSKNFDRLVDLVTNENGKLEGDIESMYVMAARNSYSGAPELKDMIPIWFKDLDNIRKYIAEFGYEKDYAEYEINLFLARSSKYVRAFAKILPLPFSANLSLNQFRSLRTAMIALQLERARKNHKTQYRNQLAREIQRFSVAFQPDPSRTRNDDDLYHQLSIQLKALADAIQKSKGSFSFLDESRDQFPFHMGPIYHAYTKLSPLLPAVNNLFTISLSIPEVEELSEKYPYFSDFLEVMMKYRSEVRSDLPFTMLEFIVIAQFATLLTDVAARKIYKQVTHWNLRQMKSSLEQDPRKANLSRLNYLTLIGNSSYQKPNFWSRTLPWLFGRDNTTFQLALDAYDAFNKAAEKNQNPKIDEKIANLPDKHPFKPEVRAQDRVDSKLLRSEVRSRHEDDIRFLESELKFMDVVASSQNRSLSSISWNQHAIRMYQRFMARKEYELSIDQEELAEELKEGKALVIMPPQGEKATIFVVVSHKDKFVTLEKYRPAQDPSMRESRHIYTAKFLDNFPAALTVFLPDHEKFREFARKAKFRSETRMTNVADQLVESIVDENWKGSHQAVAIEIHATISNKIELDEFIMLAQSQLANELAKRRNQALVVPNNEGEFSEAFYDSAKSIVSAIGKIDHMAVIAYDMSQDALNHIDPNARRTVLASLAETASDAVASNKHIVIRLILPSQEALRQTNVRTQKNNQIRVLRSGNTLTIMNSNNSDYLKASDADPTISVRDEAVKDASDYHLGSRTYADGKQIKLNEDVASKLLIAALAYISISEETAKFIANIDGKNLQVRSQDALLEISRLVQLLMQSHAQKTLTSKAA